MLFNLITPFLLVIIPSVASFTFNLTNIGPSNQNRDIVTEGVGSYISVYGIQVTPNEIGAVRDQESGRASSVITVGGAMGLPVNATTMVATSKFVAVEFDTYFNHDWDPVVWDPTVGVNLPMGDHVGININSVTSVRSQKWLSNITGGAVCQAWISYDSVSNNLSVSFTGFQNNTVVRQDGLVYTVDLRKELPEWVIFGFSASTGAMFQKNNVRSWTFNSSDLQTDNGIPPNPGPGPVEKKNIKHLTMVDDEVEDGNSTLVFVDSSDEVEDGEGDGSMVLVDVDCELHPQSVDLAVAEAFDNLCDFLLTPLSLLRNWNFGKCDFVIGYLMLKLDFVDYAPKNWSALVRKGKNKAASSLTARAKKSRQQPETEQIPKPNLRKTEALCDQHEVWQEELVYDKMAALMRTQRVLDEDSQYTFKVHWFLSVKGLHDRENWKYTLTKRKHILKDRKTGQVLFGVREDVTSLAEDLIEEEKEEGDTEESESESESESETETKKATRHFKKSVLEHVVANRPTDYAESDSPFQILWDQNARIYEKLMIVIGMWSQEGNTMIWCMVPPPPSEPSGSGSSNAFDFHGTKQDVDDMFKEYFGEQVKSQPYDNHYNPSDYQPPGSGTH
ncbi:hypothetical protein L1987_55183 [Smallanthus sonchifolius]|uniref:Uncharacterized protein n=1 Tax=Smallanthus sonchifolius TaxID=185202 RepID=A0ACB9E9B9_9ASTR|nr:hypothetical protein L1987_55183 [Smallanthus sonchifolius]